MRRAFTVVDNALPDEVANSLRSSLDKESFIERENPRDGFKYKGISEFPLPGFEKMLADALFVPVEWIKPSLNFWKLSLDGDNPEFKVHSDDIMNKHVALLYFSRDEHATGGTAFWKHVSGLTEMPTVPALEAEGFNHGVFCHWLSGEVLDPSKWTCTDIIGFKFNRLMISSTQAFHSRAPFVGWGNDATNGRLVWTCFFDVVVPGEVPVAPAVPKPLVVEEDISEPVAEPEPVVAKPGTEYRLLTENEVVQLVPLGQEFFDVSGLPGKFNPDHFVATWQRLITLGVAHIHGVWKDGVAVGAAGFVLTPDINTGNLSASECFFYVRPEHRGCGHRLFLETEKALKARGAFSILMINLTNSSADGHAKYYQRMGYRSLEHVFIKEAN